MAVLLVAAIVAGCGGGNSGDDEVRLGTETAERPAAEPKPRNEKPAATPEKLIGDRASASFDSFAEGLGGEVGVTVGAPGSPDSERLGSLASDVAWSTIKVPIAARVLQEAGGPGGLSPELEQAMRSALTASDNAAAEVMFSSLGADASAAAASTTEILREAGDRTTKVSDQGRDGFSPYGQTEWSLPAQQRFMARLTARCVVDAESSDYLLSLMGEVIPDQRWGLGSTGPAARFKGGWGPGLDGGYLVRQMGVIEVGGKRIVVTLAATPSDGQFTSGTEMLTELSGWVADNVNAAAARPRGC